MTCGILVTLTGLVFSTICFVNAVLNPWNYNGVSGLLGALLGTSTLIPFIVSLVVMILGLAICFWTAFRKKFPFCRLICQPFTMLHLHTSQ